MSSSVTQPAPIGPLEALDAVSFRPHYTAADVWRDDTIHVDGIHEEAYEKVRRVFGLMKRSAPYSNIVIEGRAGTGKSHFIGHLRRGVTKGENVFVLIQLSIAREFWQSVAIAYADALTRKGASGRSQITYVLEALADKLSLEAREKQALLRGEIHAELLKSVRVRLVEALGIGPANNRFSQSGMALILLNSRNLAHQDAAQSIMLGLDTAEDQLVAELRLDQLHSREIVKGFDKILGLAGKFTLVAIDQLDGLISVAQKSGSADAQSVYNEISTALMDLAEDNPEHTLIVLSCLPTTWTMIRERGVQSAWQRFNNHHQLRLIPSVGAGQRLIAAYLGDAYGRVGFTPPYPTWPIQPSAFNEIHNYSPRDLITAVEHHIDCCREQGEITELSDLDGTENEKVTIAPEAEPNRSLDSRFDELRKAADISGLLDSETVDDRLPPLLRAGLEAWIQEQEYPRGFSIDAPPGRNPALHARLRQTLNADLEDELHWSFRAVPHSHPSAALTRLRSAVAASGLGERRALLVLRDTNWSNGAKTQEAISAFEANGGGDGSTARRRSADFLRAAGFAGRDA